MSFSDSGRNSSEGKGVDCHAFSFTAVNCVDYVSHWLLQLSIGRPAAVDDRTTAASEELSSSTGVRTWTEGACYSKPSSTSLATSPLASPV